MNIQETLAEFYQSNPLKLSADLKTEITHFDVIDLNSSSGPINSFVHPHDRKITEQKRDELRNGNVLL